jgi:MOSC domain-containing protein YiiM
MEMKELMSKYPQGVVTYISIRPERREPVKRVSEVAALAERGLQGDRYRSKGGTRQVTFIQEEHLQSIGSFLSREPVDPALTRRNIVVRGINLLTLKGKRFRVGQALLEYSGECHPCSRMEENLGEGGYNAMRGHGGITARVIESGLIREGDAVTIENESISTNSQS